MAALNLARSRAKSCKNRMREKSKFIKQFSAESAVQSCTQKYSAFGKSEIVPLTAASRLGKRGVRVVTDVERGMRWTRRCRQTNDIGADGEVVWSWHPLAGAKLATMLCIAPITVTKTSWTPGRARSKPFKTS